MTAIARRLSLRTARQVWVTMDARGRLHYRTALRSTELFIGVAAGAAGALYHLATTRPITGLGTLGKDGTNDHTQ